MSECLFCNIAQGVIPARIIYQDEEVLAFEDINPQAPVHILVIPRKHISQISEMEAEDIPLVGKCVYVARQLAEEKNISQTGFRLVYNNGKDGGQHVYHIHLHLLGGRAMHWPPG